MASSWEIEREVESNRAQVESTLGALKEKMSFGQIVDEFGGHVNADEAKAALRNVGRQVRDNPVAFGLVGVGLAWLMFGGGGGSRRAGWEREEAYGDYGRRGGDRYGDDGYAEPDYDPYRAREAEAWSGRGGSYPGGSPGHGAEAGADGPGLASRAAHAVSDAASGVGRALGDAAHRASDVAHRAGDAVSDAVHEAGESARALGRDGSRRLRHMGEGVGRYVPHRSDLPGAGRVGHAVADAVERQPLLAGAVAAAVGAALAAALPASRTEDRLLGEGRDGMVDEARRAARDLGRHAVDAAKAGVEAAAEAARDEGLAPEPGGPTLANRVERVVRTGVEGARDSLAGDASPEGEGEAAQKTQLPGGEARRDA